MMCCRGFRGSRYLMQGQVIVSHSFPRDTITYACLIYLLLVPKVLHNSIHFFILLIFFNKSLYLSRGIRGPCRFCLTGMGMPIVQSGRSHDRSNFNMENSIYVRNGVILVYRPDYGSNIKTGMRTYITKL